MANPNQGGAVERSIRVRVLETIKPEDWLVWKRYFLNLARMWAWSDNRIRGELITAMDGDAARATADIDLVGKTPDECIAAYEERFITRSGSELAETSFRRAKQGETNADETILQFHARCRELFVRAYPGEATEGPGLARNLRNIFIFGLSEPRITEYVYDRRPDTYTDCLSYAQEKHSTIMILDEKKKQGASLNAMGQPPVRTGSNDLGATTNEPRNVCHGCLQPGHFARSCPVFLRLKERGICRLNQSTNKRGNPNRGRGRGRGRGNTRGTGSGSQRRVGAVTEQGNIINSTETDKTPDAGRVDAETGLLQGNLSALSL